MKIIRLIAILAVFLFVAEVAKAGSRITKLFFLDMNYLSIVALNPFYTNVYNSIYL